MQLEITVVSVELDVAIEKNAGGTYKGFRLAYRDASGSLKEKTAHMNSLKFNPTLKTALSNLAAGDKAVLTMEKEGDFWNIKSIVKDGQVSAKPTNDTPASAGTKVTATASPRSTYETPEERAKKQVYIVRQSSISSAIDLLTLQGDKKVDVTKVIETAKELEKYVFGDAFDDGSLTFMKGDEDVVIN